MERTTWQELPPDARDAVTAHVGAVHTAVDIPDGLTCRMAARLDTGRGPVFVKGVPAADAHGSLSQGWESAVAPSVAAVAPRLLRWMAAGGWELLLFDWIDGRHADLSPDSPDLAAVADVLAVAQAVRVPDGLAVQQLGSRYGAHLDARGRELLWGETLLHTDTNPHNLIVGATRAWMVDWAMPAAGPAWVDAAYTAVRLMEADCTAEQALGWLDGFPAWKAANRRAVAAWVGAEQRAWTARVGEQAARPSNARFEALLG